MLEHLGIGDRGVGHVAVHRVGAVEAGAGAAAAADRLVVAEALVAEQHVVHRALAAGGHPEGLEQGVDQPLAGLHVAPHDRRRAGRILGKGRVEEAFRELDLDPPQ